MTKPYITFEMDISPLHRFPVRTTHQATYKSVVPEKELPQLFLVIFSSKQTMATECDVNKSRRFDRGMSRRTRRSTSFAACYQDQYVPPLTQQLCQDSKLKTLFQCQDRGLQAFQQCEGPQLQMPYLYEDQDLRIPRSPRLCQGIDQKAYQDELEMKPHGYQDEEQGKKQLQHQDEEQKIQLQYQDEEQKPLQYQDEEQEKEQLQHQDEGQKEQYQDEQEEKTPQQYQDEEKTPQQYQDEEKIPQQYKDDKEKTQEGYQDEEKTEQYQDEEEKTPEQYQDEEKKPEQYQDEEQKAPKQCQDEDEKASEQYQDEEQKARKKFQDTEKTAPEQCQSLKKLITAHPVHDMPRFSLQDLIQEKQLLIGEAKATSKLGYEENVHADHKISGAAATGGTTLAMVVKRPDGGKKSMGVIRRCVKALNHMIKAKHGSKKNTPF